MPARGHGHARRGMGIDALEGLHAGKPDDLTVAVPLAPDGETKDAFGADRPRVHVPAQQHHMASGHRQGRQAVLRIGLPHARSSSEWRLNARPRHPIAPGSLSCPAITTGSATQAPPRSELLRGGALRRAGSRRFPRTSGQGLAFLRRLTFAPPPSEPVNFSVEHRNAQASDASAIAVVHVCV